MNLNRKIAVFLSASVLILYTILLLPGIQCTHYQFFKHTSNAKPAVVYLINPGSTTGAEIGEAKTASEQVTSVPWENDENFIKVQKENNTSVLLAAYKTVLRDPLPGEEYNVHLAADMLAGTIVKPGQIFSQNHGIGPYTEDRGFKKGPTYIGSQLSTTVGGGVCKIASTLYNVTVFSNLQVVERHSHSMPVPYVPYGQDATVAYGALDFKFKNTTSGPVLIWAKGIDNTLYMAFYGTAAPPKVIWHHQILDVQKAPVIYKKNPALEPSTEKLVLEGMDGASVRSWITIENPDGTVSTREMGNSSYRPMSYIIEKGS